MNREIQITIIGCAIIFASIGFVVYEMNYDQMTTIQPKKIKMTFDDPPFQSNSLPDSTQKTNDNTSIAKSTILLKIPTNNTIPFGTISGIVNYPTVGHPVIIQFFRSLDDSPVHVAQVDLNDDNTFEYKFRLFSIDDGITTHFFSGDYFIKIFATVNAHLINSIII